MSKHKSTARRSLAEQLGPATARAIAKALDANTTKRTIAQRERDAAREQLRDILRPGDRVYCILRHVSRSGMQRVIDLQVLTTDDNGRPWLRTIGGWAAKAMGTRYDYKRSGIVMNGCGSDMGWEAVYHLAHSLWPTGHGCIGGKCPSNDHSNGDRDYVPHPGCGNPDVGLLPHWHRDGGYALKHEWV